MTVRLLGVAASGLTDRQQLALFHDDRRTTAAGCRGRGCIRKRYGAKSIKRARLLDSRLASRSSETHADRTVRINPDNRRPLVGDVRYAELGVEHVMFQCEPYATSRYGG
jgi:hypothetical protein